ncbi:fimbria/pilus outer membrane usher protein [Variovorax sp. PCZ-1]|uniref:fimbria/pilus outer membrane usher protein n=1 Tax=Variovorax sp. PCZ-1 TaxID=2835533 RepID=UPI001BCC429C|nr:fimbria/pilus outer membrane usher protein [Variovorax sp. PCZ-1]MBS7808032.1 fimbrial biogenesis outer membrane usher protein [Variovorax sp. PCZ-1]
MKCRPAHPLVSALFRTGLMVGCLIPVGAQAQISPAPSSVGTPIAPALALRILPLEVRVNGAPSGNWLFLERDGMLYALEDAFTEWRLHRRDNVQPLIYRSQAWYSLGSVPGYESRLNFADQSIDLVFSPNAFASTRLANDDVQKLDISPSVPAVFFNYDLNYSQSWFRNAGGVGTRDLGALTEAGLSGNWGVLTSSFVGRNLMTSDPALSSSWRRLETTFTRDLPDHKLTLRLGDASTRGGVGSRSVYFGGVQLTRNFALTPGFISQPIPVIQGTSSAPSTVELYVNDALRQTSNVPTGPFAIDNFPLLTGGGNVRMVVRDVLGRETVIVQPFFSHSSLLEKGLSDWSVEFGAVRENLGTDSAKYGQGFGSGLYRYGFSKETTGEISAQIGSDTQTLGLGLNLALPFQMLGYASLATSRDKTTGKGTEWGIGLEYSHLKHGFNGRVTSASRDYRQLGLTGNSLPNKLESALNYSYNSERFGALGVGLARIDTYGTGEIRTASANYSMRIGQRSTLSVSATRAFGSGVAAPATSIGLSLNIPLDNRMNSSTSVNHRAGQTDAYTSVSQAPVGELGTGWRALAGVRADKGYAEAGLYHQASKALVTGDISANASQQNMRLGLQSALVFIDGQLHASRRVQDSFAIVEVPGYADVGVGFQGSVQARTDASGRAFLPRLQSFQRNNIRLDPSELPISAEIDNIEQITVPAARSGVKIIFPVRTGRAALIKIILADGQDAPAGAEIELVGDKQEFFVARRGEAFMTGLQPKNTLVLKHNGTNCKIQLELPPESKADDILRLGPVRCEGVKR